MILSAIGSLCCLLISEANTAISEFIIPRYLIIQLLLNCPTEYRQNILSIRKYQQYSYSIVFITFKMCVYPLKNTVSIFNRNFFVLAVPKYTCFLKTWQNLVPQRHFLPTCFQSLLLIWQMLSYLEYNTVNRYCQ